MSVRVAIAATLRLARWVLTALVLATAKARRLRRRARRSAAIIRMARPTGMLAFRAGRILRSDLLWTGDGGRGYAGFARLIGIVSARRLVPRPLIAARLPVRPPHFDERHDILVGRCGLRRCSFGRGRRRGCIPFGRL